MLTGDFRIYTLKVNVSHPSVVFGREVLGEVIGKVFSSLLPVEAELVLLDVAAHPVEAHVKSFGALTAHVAGEYSVVGRAVGNDWGGWLRVAHFDEVCVDSNSLMAVEEYCSSFGLGSGSHDGADGLTFGENPIWSWNDSTPNGPILTKCQTIRTVMASAAEAKTGAIFLYMVYV